ncbi:MAG: BON domain-containing protein [Magnetovibrio sp.]|nr:BON domain-containing protein [Magnetovibrio sp.]
MLRKSAIVPIFALSLLFSVQACGPVGLIVGAGAVSGVAAMQERGVDGVARDLRTSSHIFDLFTRNNHILLKDVSVEVYEGRVLLTGQVSTENDRAQAVRLAWSAAGTRDVLNEIHVTQDGSFLNTARDSWITAQLEAKLTFDERVLAINYAIETVGATIYLIGIAQNQAELDRVKDQARSIPYVEHIISHVRVKKAPRPAEPK